jgi:phosphate transport system substrate-binding protein
MLTGRNEMKKIVCLAAAIALSMLFSGVGTAKDDMIQIKGSDTLINMVQVLSENYMKGHPDVKIAVTGGGSGTGIAALINKRCDIANASRGITAKEVESATNAGLEPKRIVVAIDGLSIIVNEKNPIDKLTIDEIGKIYRGDIRSWKDVGGSDTPVSLYGRQSNSGTYDFMKENVLKGEFSSNMKAMNGNAQIIEGVKQDIGGIGFVGVGYAKEASGITVLNVALSPSMGYFSPLNSADVRNGVYPITRPLNQYINGTPKGPVLDFLLYELSDEGQSIVERQGFFSVPEEYSKYNRDTLGKRVDVRESPVAKYSVEGRDGS